VDKDNLELIKVVSLAVIAISSAIIAWRMGKVVNYLYDLVSNGCAPIYRTPMKIKKAQNPEKTTTK
jgi:hypothetical protein